MDWTNSLGEAHAINDATRLQWQIDNWPNDASRYVDAGLAGLLSGLSLGRTEGTNSSMLRQNYPVTYRVGQYGPAWYAAHLGAMPLAGALAGVALANEPSVQTYYNDHLAPRPHLESAAPEPAPSSKAGLFSPEILAILQKYGLLRP